MIVYTIHPPYVLIVFKAYHCLTSKRYSLKCFAFLLIHFICIWLDFRKLLLLSRQLAHTGPKMGKKSTDQTFSTFSCQCHYYRILTPGPRGSARARKKEACCKMKLMRHTCTTAKSNAITVCIENDKIIDYILTQNCLLSHFQDGTHTHTYT